MEYETLEAILEHPITDNAIRATTGMLVSFTMGLINNCVGDPCKFNKSPPYHKLAYAGIISAITFTTDTLEFTENIRSTPGSILGLTTGFYFASKMAQLKEDHYGNKPL